MNASHIYVAPEAELNALRDSLARQFDGKILSHDNQHGELTVAIQRDALLDICTWLKASPSYAFTMLIDITALDNPAEIERFTVVYNLLSLTSNLRIRLKITTDEATPVASVVDIWKAAGWFEREAFDMFGVTFAGNPDLRRILTDYGFEGHPLRKDFPLTGYTEMRYDPEQKRVIYEPVKLTQDFRRFEFLSPWEGMTDVQLPGDEKAVKPLGS